MIPVRMTNALKTTCEHQLTKAQMDFMSELQYMYYMRYSSYLHISVLLNGIEVNVRN